MKLFYTDAELADMLGVSKSLIRKMVKQGPSRRGTGVIDIRLAEYVTIGDMRRWRKDQIDKLLGIEQQPKEQTQWHSTCHPSAKKRS